MKISYFRKVCENGLHSWSDVHLSMDSYLKWLSDGQPAHFEAKKVITTVDDGIDVIEQKKEEILKKSFKHKNLSIEYFTAELVRLLQQFTKANDSITLDVYKKLKQTPIYKDGETLLIDAGLPKRLVSMALDRLEQEKVILESDNNGWLLYNAANFSLYSEKSGLSFDSRANTDQKVFNNLNSMLLV